jgi:tripartite-type tricarboxylate transporter receptor subunit TctC
MGGAWLPDYEISFWYGLFVPVGTPDEAQKRLFAATRTALENPKVAEIFGKEGTETSGSKSPEEFERFVASEQILWARLVRESGAKPE